MDTAESTVYRSTDDHHDHHPHACSGGFVFLTYTTHDEEVGDEVERIEAIPCRRCAESPSPMRQCFLCTGTGSNVDLLT